MTSRQAKNTPRRRGKSTGDGLPEELRDGYFLGQAKKRLETDLQQLTGKKASSKDFSYKVTEDFFSSRGDDSGMVSNSFSWHPRRPGQARKPETDLVIEAEAQRLFKARTTKLPVSQRKVSEQFWPELPRDKRYAKYRTRVKDHAKKIQARLSKLIGT